MRIKVAIVEDDIGICRELEHVIASDPDLSCVCVCRNREAALTRIPPAAPDVIVMDIHLPDGSGIDCTTRLKRVLPAVEILMYTIFDETDQIVKALGAGASGYILKDANPSDILKSIHEIRNEGGPMSPDVARKLIETFQQKPLSRFPETLTRRESEILELLADGLLYKEIGEKLDIKMDTVCTHTKSIYRKLHVRSRTEAVMKFLR